MSNLARVNVERVTNNEKKRRNEIKEMIEKLTRQLEYCLQIKNEIEQQKRYRMRVENNLVRYQNSLMDIDFYKSST